MKDPLKSAKKVLDILCLFGGEQSEFSAQEISSMMGIPLSSTYKYLEILTKAQFFQKAQGKKKYSLGPTLLKLSLNCSPEMTFLDIAIRHMKNLSQQTNETVFLSTLKGWEAQIVEKIEPKKTVRLSLEKGAMIPLHAGAAQKVLLANQKEDFIDRFIEATGLKGMTTNTIIDPQILKEELSQIKEQGFASSDSEVHSWTMAIGAPVFDRKKSVIAGLGIAIPKEEGVKERIPGLVKLLKSSAGDISKEIGYKPKKKSKT